MIEPNANPAADKRSSTEETVPGARTEGGPDHVLATASLADDRTGVFKDGDTSVVFDHYSDIKPGGLGEEGLCHEGTRYLS
jgi:hypothetical protein